LRIVNFGGREQGVQRIVPGDGEAGKIGQKLTAVVEKNEEEVQESEAANDIDFRDT
jgi:hypothetical protein